MRKLTFSVIIAVAVVAAAFSYPRDAKLAAPEGVWKLVEVTITNDEGTTVNEVMQPNLTIFAKGHYASVGVFGEEPRAELGEDPTDEQLLAAWRPFNASAGSYSVYGSDMTTKVIIHKNPNPTANQRERTAPFELDGDTLYRTFTNPENGNTFKLKYARVE